MRSLTAPVGHVLGIDPFVEHTMGDIIRLHRSHIQPWHHDIQRIDGTLQMLITRVLIPLWLCLIRVHKMWVAFREAM